MRAVDTIEGSCFSIVLRGQLPAQSDWDKGGGGLSRRVPRILWLWL